MTERKKQNQLQFPGFVHEPLFKSVPKQLQLFSTDPMPVPIVLDRPPQDELQVTEEIQLSRNDDASQLIISGFGLHLSKKGERLIIRKGREYIFEFPFFRLSEITLTSKGISLSSDLIMELCERGVQINFLKASGRPYAKITAPALSATILARREQLRALDDDRGVKICKIITHGKLTNQRKLLLYFAKYIKGTRPSVFDNILATADHLKKLSSEVKKADAQSIDEIRKFLMGIEGTASRIYWDAVQQIVKERSTFMGRVRRGATDEMNSMLNYCYGILYSLVWGAVITAGLEPFAGFLHVDRPGRPSLVLDMVEEFRQPVVDRTVIAHVNRGEPIRMEGGLLSKETRHHISQKMMERLESKERYQGKYYQIRSIIQIQARNLAAFFRGEKDYRPFSFKW